MMSAFCCIEKFTQKAKKKHHDIKMLFSNQFFILLDILLYKDFKWHKGSFPNRLLPCLPDPPFLYLFLIALMENPSSSLSPPSRYPLDKPLDVALSLPLLTLECLRRSARSRSSSSLTRLYRLAVGSRPTCEMTLIPVAL